MAKPEFRDDGEKFRWLQGVTTHDSTDPRVRATAAALWQVARGRDVWFAKLALALVRDCIAYQTDTARVGGEDFQPAGKIGALLEAPNPVDDCDSKVRLFCALCAAVGIGATPEPHWEKTPEGHRLKHVSARCMVGGRAFHVETTLARARLGERHNEVPKEADGRWRT